MLDKKSVYIALGYFDSVHIGHQKVIAVCKEKAGDNFTPALFTFKGNLKRAIGISDGKCVFNYFERKEIFESLGIKEILFAPVSKSFLSKGKVAFLNYLNKQYNINGYICGKDFHFGKNGEGDIAFLSQYALIHNQSVDIVDIVNMDNEKVSTSRIKNCLKNGEIERANNLLGFDYFLTGKVFHDRKIGRSLGFPTINIKTDDDRFLLKDGVYAGYIYFDNKRYKIAINYGTRPTFELNNKLIEGHILDFNGNLYGKTVKIYFTKYIRDIIKFNDVNELKEQIKKDIEMVRL